MTEKYGITIPGITAQHIQLIIEHAPRYPIARDLAKHVTGLKGIAPMDIFNTLRRLRSLNLIAPSPNAPKRGKKTTAPESDEESSEPEEQQDKSFHSTSRQSHYSGKTTNKRDSAPQKMQITTAHSSGANGRTSGKPASFSSNSTNYRANRSSTERTNASSGNQAMDIDEHFSSASSSASTHSVEPNSSYVGNMDHAQHSVASPASETPRYMPNSGLTITLPMRANLTLYSQPGDGQPQESSEDENTTALTPILAIPTGGKMIASTPAMPKSLVEEFVTSEQDPAWKYTPVIDILAPHPYVQCIQDEFQGFSIVIGPFYPGTQTSLNFFSHIKQVRLTVVFPDHQYDPQLPPALLKMLDVRPPPFTARIRIPIGVYWGHIEIRELESYTVIQFYHIRSIANPGDPGPTAPPRPNSRRILPPADGKMRIYSMNKNRAILVECLDLPN